MNKIIGFLKECKSRWLAIDEGKRLFICVSAVALLYAGHEVLNDWKRDNDGFLLPHKWETYTENGIVYRKCVRHSGLERKIGNSWRTIVYCDGEISKSYADYEATERFYRLWEERENSQSPQ